MSGIGAFNTSICYYTLERVLGGLITILTSYLVSHNYRNSWKFCKWPRHDGEKSITREANTIILWHKISRKLRPEFRRYNSHLINEICQPNECCLRDPCSSLNSIYQKCCSIVTQARGEYMLHIYSCEINSNSLYCTFVIWHSITAPKLHDCCLKDDF